jgi:putative membrane protein
MSFKSHALIGILGLLPVLGFSQTDGETSPPIASQVDTMSSSRNSIESSAEDRRFIARAFMSGMAEFELGKLALQKATNREVKRLTLSILSDYSHGNSELKDIAKSINLLVPTISDAKTEVMRKELSSLSGSEFDSTYLSDLVERYSEKMREFRREKNSATNVRLKQFAAKALLRFEDHVVSAVQILTRLGGPRRIQGLRDITRSIDARAQSTGDHIGE